MADPILDENLLLARLKSPPNVIDTENLQSAAMGTLLDIYDRKVTREEFIKMASPCVALYAAVGRFELLMSIKECFDAETLDVSSFTVAATGIKAAIDAHSASVTETVNRLKACPTSQDKVH